VAVPARVTYANDEGDYRLSGNGEYASYTWYLNNASGVPMVALNHVKDVITRSTPSTPESPTST